jgi:Spy/CpxP family protein refolding chaperone
MIRKFSQVVVLGLMAGVLAFPQGPGRSRMGPGGGSERMMHFATSVLDLNDVQQAQGKSIFSTARESSQALHTQLRDNRTALQAAIISGAVEQIDTLAAAQGVLQGKLAAINAKAYAQFYATLTPDQKKKAEALHSFGGPGGMGGPGGRGLALQ